MTGEVHRSWQSGCAGGGLIVLAILIGLIGTPIAMLSGLTVSDGPISLSSRSSFPLKAHHTVHLSGYTDENVVVCTAEGPDGHTYSSKAVFVDHDNFFKASLTTGPKGDYHLDCGADNAYVEVENDAAGDPAAAIADEHSTRNVIIVWVLAAATAAVGIGVLVAGSRDARAAAEKAEAKAAADPVDPPPPGA